MARGFGFRLCDVTYWGLAGNKRIYDIGAIYRNNIPLFPTNHQ